MHGLRAGTGPDNSQVVRSVARWHRRCFHLRAFALPTLWFGFRGEFQIKKSRWNNFCCNSFGRDVAIGEFAVCMLGLVDSCLTHALPQACCMRQVARNAFVDEFQEWRTSLSEDEQAMLGRQSKYMFNKTYRGHQLSRVEVVM
eukprot:338618-Amphidinium_carterae.2